MMEFKRKNGVEGTFKYEGGIATVTFKLDVPDEAAALKLMSEWGIFKLPKPNTGKPSANGPETTTDPAVANA